MVNLVKISAFFVLLVFRTCHQNVCATIVVNKTHAMRLNTDQIPQINFFLVCLFKLLQLVCNSVPLKFNYTLFTVYENSKILFFCKAYTVKNSM